MNQSFDLEAAHKHSVRNRSELLRSGCAGCFYCLRIIPVNDIQEWVDRGKVTALCPKCGIDALIGDVAGIPLTKEFLKAMHDHWFSVDRALARSMRKKKD